MSSSKVLFFLCLAFVGGIFLESLIKIPQIFIWGFLFVAVMLIFVSLTLLMRSSIQGSYFVIFGFCLLMAIMGVLRVQISEFNIANDKLSKLNGKGEITLAGIVSDEPDLRDTSQKIKIKIGDSTILVTAKRYPEYKYLDKIKLTGKLETPSETEDFSYKNYLMKDGIYSVMNFPKTELLGHNAYRTSVSEIYSGVLWFKQKLRESIRQNYSPPQSLILEGTVLGNNGVMTQDLKDKLNATGLRHIIAVSGTHVVILSSILMSFLLMLGLWRGQAFYFSVVLIWLYIVLTGFSASGIRAGIMGSLFLLAQKLGKQSSGSRIITIAGALMLLQNPLLLFYDIGFQLSFLAAMGIIYLDPVIKFFSLKFFPAAAKAGSLLSIISATFAAQIFTLPVMVYNFGNISLIAPLTNLLVLPTIPLMMGFGFASSILGIISQFLGWLTSMPCWFLLAYFIKIMDIFSQPWAIETIKNVHWVWLAISYLIIGSAINFLNKKYIRNFV